MTAVIICAVVVRVFPVNERSENKSLAAHQNADGFNENPVPIVLLVSTEKAEESKIWASAELESSPVFSTVGRYADDDEAASSGFCARSSSSSIVAHRDYSPLKFDYAAPWPERWTRSRGRERVLI